MIPQTKSQFDGLVNILKESIDKAAGEVYCFSERKLKVSANYARASLSVIMKTAKQLRKDLLIARKGMPVKRKKKD